MQSAMDIPSFAAVASRWCTSIELTKDSSGSYSASVTDANGVLSDFDFSSNSGSGITFSQQGNTLTITATAEAAKELSSEKTYSATGSAYGMDPDEAVLCWYDSTGKYQSLASYTGVGRDPVKTYIKIRAAVVEETGSITVYKVDVTGTPLSGTELLLEVSPDGNSWAEVSRVTTGADGIAKWEELTVGAQYRITEAKAPAGYSLLAEPLTIGTLTADSPDITITACNNANFALPFTGSHGFIAPLLFAALMLGMGVYFCRKSDLKKENH